MFAWYSCVMAKPVWLQIPLSVLINVLLLGPHEGIWEVLGAFLAICCIIWAVILYFSCGLLKTQRCTPCIA